MHKAEIFAAFAEALRLADERVGATAPNPPVGCAALDVEGRVLAVAAHQRAGAPHAEALVLARCAAEGVLSRAHTLAVTLEPCNHFGRTPPCTQAVLASPVQEVWMGTGDPNPRVAGAGLAALEAGGRRVVRLDQRPEPEARALAAASAELIAPFAKWLRTGRPWVVVKRALDEAGSMIPPPGRKTFTSEASLVLAHRLRKRTDAVLTGVGTVLADAPEFTVRRVPDHEDRRRLLLVLDRSGRTPQAYRHAADARGFHVHRVGELGEALELAGRAGALSILVEAGPQVMRSVLEAELWDECVTIRKSAAADGADAVERLSSAPPGLDGRSVQPIAGPA